MVKVSYTTFNLFPFPSWEEAFLFLTPAQTPAGSPPPAGEVTAHPKMHFVKKEMQCRSFQGNTISHLRKSLKYFRVHSLHPLTDALGQWFSSSGSNQNLLGNLVKIQRSRPSPNPRSQAGLLSFFRLQGDSQTHPRLRTTASGNGGCGILFLLSAFYF